MYSDAAPGSSSLLSFPASSAAPGTSEFRVQGWFFFFAYRKHTFLPAYLPRVMMATLPTLRNFILSSVVEGKRSWGWALGVWVW